MTGAHRKYAGSHRRLIPGRRQRRSSRVFGVAVALLFIMIAALAAWAVMQQGVHAFLH